MSKRQEQDIRDLTQAFVAGIFTAAELAYLCDCVTGVAK